MVSRKNLNIIIKLEEQKWELLANEDFTNWLSDLKNMKKELPLMYDRGEFEFRKAIDEYALSKDLYDICVTANLANSGHIDFRLDYYSNIVQGKE